MNPRQRQNFIKALIATQQPVTQQPLTKAIVPVTKAVEHHFDSGLFATVTFIGVLAVCGISTLCRELFERGKREGAKEERDKSKKRGIQL